MIWLTWRQFRGQALVAVAVLVALGTYLVVLGLRIRNAYEVNVGCAGCDVGAAKDVFENAYFTPLLLTGFLVVLVPGILGAFWGAPLLAREFESGTHRLVWNQSVTRTRWLAVKLGFVTLAGMLLTGALSLLLTWAASPYDRLFEGRFDPLLFPARNIAPLGYAVFAVVAGITVGLLVRRTLPAMAILLAGFVLLQILIPTTVRPHLQPAVTETVAWTAANARGLQLNGAGEVRTEGFAVPGAWVLTGNPQLFDASGQPANREQFEDCPHTSPDVHKACVESKGFHMVLSYQPADRYWTFQWLELGLYLVLAALLAGFAFWRIPRGLN
ncbi:transporter [Plantactinospora sp. BB1]|uniref:transporter n=1 Tax=Plantactinospora sp. BB1 TaxID=2071627 RepID=UPI000D15FF4B|nr:transporter [Plantactinospora sp. BB1]AVT35986.1 transporter [Plantactinospora sp. BB1]